MIFKQQKRKTYTVIDNGALRDPGLSFKATGLLAFLLSLPDNWRPNTRHLSSIKTDGRASVTAGMRELEEAGYLRRRKILQANGTIDWIIDVFEHPTMAQKPSHGEPEIDTPWIGFPSTENPRAGNRANKESLRSTDDERTSKEGDERRCVVDGVEYVLHDHTWVPVCDFDETPDYIDLTEELA